MRKRLTRHGNSFAIVIDKPVRKLLGIGPERLVDLSFDGRRLIIEPVDADSKPPRRAVSTSGENRLTFEEAREAPKVLARLTNVWGMADETFARLSDVKPRIGPYCVRVNDGTDQFEGEAGAGMRATVRRLSALLEILDEGAGWEHAIVEVLRRMPLKAAAPPKAATSSGAAIATPDSAGAPSGG